MFVLTGSCIQRSYFNCEFSDLYDFKHCKLLKGWEREGNKGRAIFLIFSATLSSHEFCHRNKQGQD